MSLASAMVCSEFTWFVPVDHPACDGHFPDCPIVPGALLLDQAVHCAETCCGQTMEGWQVMQAKFFVPAIPGSVLDYALDQIGDGRVTFTVRSGDIILATGILKPLP